MSDDCRAYVYPPFDEGDPTEADGDSGAARYCPRCDRLQWRECFGVGQKACEDCLDPGPEDCYTQRELS